jgi:hypothetical protein
MINVVDPSILSAEDRLAIEQQKKTIYQVSFPKLYLGTRLMNRVYGGAEKGSGWKIWFESISIVLDYHSINFQWTAEHLKMAVCF